MSVSYTKSADEAFRENYSYSDITKSSMKSTKQKIILFIIISSFLILAAIPFLNPCMLLNQPAAIFSYAVMAIGAPILAIQWGMDASISYARQHIFCEKL